MEVYIFYAVMMYCSDRSMFCRVQRCSEAVVRTACQVEYHRGWPDGTGDGGVAGRIQAVSAWHEGLWDQLRQCVGCRAWWDHQSAVGWRWLQHRQCRVSSDTVYKRVHLSRGRGPSSPEIPEISKLSWNCPEFWNCPEILVNEYKCPVLFCCNLCSIHL